MEATWNGKYQHQNTDSPRSPPYDPSPAMDEKAYNSLTEDADETGYFSRKWKLTHGELKTIVDEAVNSATGSIRQLLHKQNTCREANELAAEKVLKARLKKEKKERLDERKELVDMIREMALELDDDNKEPEADDPIVLKDAVGRKFIFPFESCKTWRSFADLITQAFTHVDTLGPHVAEGYYDILSPKGFVILPSVWDDIVEPGWEVSMHMWPMAEAWTPAAPVPPPPPARAGGESCWGGDWSGDGERRGERERGYKRCEGRKREGRRGGEEEEDISPPRHRTIPPSLESSRASLGDSTTSVATERNVVKEALAEEEKAGEWDIVDD